MSLAFLNQEKPLGKMHVQNVEYHERTLYQTMRGTVWTLPRTVTISEGEYRLEFIFDDDDEKLSLLSHGSGRKNEDGEIIVYSYSFRDISKFDMRGRLIS
ncbi:hypothetical protein POF51_25900 [Brevibacillus sp. AG]|uniref:hypothetical protein n=1 Tax=Brevibacillus sp. AG TaxID=3020891 RepID=UPI00233090F2|nr:hypothetical protein [Brevibacillus sp. AG]MDC0764157.1 hypothetical protein [Brevibacillus sp. AG]